MKAKPDSESLGGGVDWVIESVAEVRHLGKMSREHACHRTALRHGSCKLFGGGLWVLRRQQRDEFESRRVRLTEVVQPIVVRPRRSGRKVTFVQAADMQSSRRVQHHHVDSILVHCRYLILGALWLRAQLAAQITVPGVVGEQVAALPTRLQELPHTRHRLAHVSVCIDHFIVSHVSSFWVTYLRWSLCQRR